MDNKGIGIAILVGLGLLGLWFFMRKAGPLLPSSVPSGNGYVGQPLRLMPAGSVADNQLAGRTVKRYINDEHWHLELNEDGIPTDVHIKRDVTEVV